MIRHARKYYQWHGIAFLLNRSSVWQANSIDFDFLQTYNYFDVVYATSDRDSFFEGIGIFKWDLITDTS